MTTPNDFGFKMPPEWTRHQRTFISWPVKESLCWPENFDEVCTGYAEVAKAIARFEPVTMLVNSETAAEASFRCGPSVELLNIDHNDSWIRDNGPTFLVNNTANVTAVNWKFNAWGEKYSPWNLDNELAPELLKRLGVQRFDAPLVMEGGSIHVDGQGTLLTTEECLLNANRNPHLIREQIQEILEKYLGIQKIIWLSRGLAGDETDGHIDNIACFARPGVVIMQSCSDQADPNYEITRENRAILEQSTDAEGNQLQIIEIPLPPAAYYQENRLTLSYLNFYFVNGGIILPIFGGAYQAMDKIAIETLQKTFPDRQIVPIDGMSLVKEGGNVHCITQQMPAGS